MAYYRDLREHIAALQEAGKLVTIEDPIDKDTELHPLVRWQYRGLPERERKAFLFSHVTDAKGRRYDLPVAVATLAASREVYAIGLQCAPHQIMERWTRAQRQPIDPVIVDTGPVHEVVHVGEDLLAHGGLEEFPVPISTPGFDVAPFLTAAHFFTRDPETGARNTGNYRGQVKGPLRTGVDVAPSQHIGIHWKKARQLGQPLPAAAVIGCTPAVSYVAVSSIPYGTDEMAVAGGLAGEPIELVRCQTVDLEVPATAEIVLEGIIHTDYLEPEAPFGEFSGYMGQRTLNPVFTITAITHRRHPLWVSFLSQMPPSESSKIKQIGREGNWFKFLKHDCNIPGILDVAIDENGGSVSKIIVIQMKKTNPAQPWQALHAASSYDPNKGKIIIVVDEDIDPRDWDSVNWALSFRMQPHRDTAIVHAKYGILDPSAAPPGNLSRTESSFPPPSGCSGLLIDATRGWDYPPVALPRRDFMERAREIWERQGLPALTPRVPWFGYDLGFWTEDDAEEAAWALAGEHYRTGARAEQRRKEL